MVCLHFTVCALRSRFACPPPHVDTERLTFVTDPPLLIVWYSLTLSAPRTYLTGLRHNVDASWIASRNSTEQDRL